MAKMFDSVFGTFYGFFDSLERKTDSALT